MILLNPLLLIQNPREVFSEKPLDGNQAKKPDTVAPSSQFISGVAGKIFPRKISPQTHRTPLTKKVPVSAAKPGNDLQAWLDTLPEIADAIVRADLDFYNLPFNRNVAGNPKASAALMRMSEYNPKHDPHPQPTVTVPKNTYGRAHAEVRPIRGSKESLITRVTLDYQGGEVFFHIPGRKGEFGKRGHLELDCFTAVTAPTIQYDGKFTKRDASVVKIGKDGNNKYENACIDPRGLATPFHSVAPPPPKTDQGENPDWMFYFQPFTKTLWNWLVITYINRKVGGLWLWANNPTFGFVDPAHYEKFGIRYNTWPRKFGDLIRFFSPLFQKETREALKQGAPFLNPNSEYLDEHGLRQNIPDDIGLVKKINAHRKKLGLPLLPRRRGTVVDWVFTDLLSDTKRMAATPADRFPSVELHLQFKPGTVLDLPIGKISVRQDTDVRFRYAITPVWRVEDGKKIIHARGELKLILGPLSLGRADLEFAGYRLKVGRSLRANSVEITLPMEQVFPEEGGWKWQIQPEKLEVRLKGLRGRNLEVVENTRGVAVKLDRAEMRQLHIYNRKGKTFAAFSGLALRDLSVEQKVGKLFIADAQIPRLEFQSRHDLTHMKLNIPEIKSKGKIRIQPNFGTKNVIALNGSALLSKINFDRALDEAGENFSTRLSFNIGGSLPEAQILNPQWGKAEFSMKKGEVTHSLSGNFSALATQPRDPEGDGGTLDYKMNFKIPYTSFHLDSPMVVMRPGESYLENGYVNVNPRQVSLEGNLHLKVREVKPVATDVLRIKNLEMSPHLEDAEIFGPALFEYGKEGFRLTKRAGQDSPLQIGFRLTESSFSHLPSLEEQRRVKPAYEVIKTEVNLDDAQVLVEDLQEVEYRIHLTKDGERRAQLFRLESGPILLHHIKGGGNFWANTLLWAWIRGRFPYFGYALSEVPEGFRKPMSKWRKKNRPDPEKLIRHLNAETRALLWDEASQDYSNFIRAGGISIRSEESQPNVSSTQIRDLTLYAHETGNFWQFAAVGIPQLNLRQTLKKNGSATLEIDTGGKMIYNHIYLHDPLRRYTKTLKSPRPYQAPPHSNPVRPD